MGETRVLRAEEYVRVAGRAIASQIVGVPWENLSSEMRQRIAVCAEQVLRYGERRAATGDDEGGSDG